jgi:signal transduction histidine kinase
MIGGPFVIVRSELWSVAVVGCLAALVLAALVLPQSFRLTAFSDLIQCLLLLSGTISFVPRVLRSQGRMRMFWALMAMGIGLWFSYQLTWTYFEVVLRQDVPDLFSGDVVLFLHIVPLMAALAVRPHVPRDEYAARLGRLDFALLIVWWFYLYVLIVMPWQFAVPNLPAYSRNLNTVYLAEKIAFLGFLAASWMGSKQRWRVFYANLFGASLTYSTSSYVANWALARKVYYSGSLYDIPLVASMAWIVLIGLWTRAHEPEARTHKASTAYGVWVARCGMIAAFSLPLFGAWALSDTAVPPRVRSFRLVLTLAAALAMSVMVFLRQRRLDRELHRLLEHSQDSFENLKRLQSQVLQSEKLASIGQLVGGAAHELNNPITAMLGYSDLLLGTELNPAQQSLATRIGQNVRRTKSLVASLLSFAKRAPASKTPLDLNTLARTAVKLTQPQWQALKIEVRTELGSDIPKVVGDSNQLLQVCLQILGNALHAMSERGGRTLTFTTLSRDGITALQISEGAPTSKASGSTSAAEAEEVLGLSACQGIVQEHRGRILCEQREDGGTTVRVELPCGSSLSQAMAPAPLLAQSPPSV